MRAIPTFRRICSLMLLTTNFWQDQDYSCMHTLYMYLFVGRWWQCRDSSQCDITVWILSHHLLFCESACQIYHVIYTHPVQLTKSTMHVLPAKKQSVLWRYPSHCHYSTHHGWELAMQTLLNLEHWLAPISSCALRPNEPTCMYYSLVRGKRPMLLAEIGENNHTSWKLPWNIMSWGGLNSSARLLFLSSFPGPGSLRDELAEKENFISWLNLSLVSYTYELLWSNLEMDQTQSVGDV